MDERELTRRLGRGWKSPPKWYWCILVLFFVLVLIDSRCDSNEIQAGDARADSGQTSRVLLIETISSVIMAIKDHTKEMKNGNRVAKEHTAAVKALTGEIKALKTQIGKGR